MGPVERMLAERACERLVYEYARFVDFGEASRVHTLFTSDGAWESPQHRMVGVDEIRAGFGAREGMKRTSRHVCTNVLIEVLSPDEARGITYFTLYREDGERDGPAPLEAPLMVGEYRDRFVCTPHGWRIAHRRADLEFLRR